MNSEKVKEIKKALECNANYENHNTLSYIDDKKCKTVDFLDILTYINELESENERLLESCKNCHYIKDLEIANGHTKELKDQITELENLCNKIYEDLTKEIDRLENARLTNITPYQVVVSDAKFEELEKNAIEDFNLTKIILKQFAERLKEKMAVREYMGVKYKQGVFSENDIDETLKEFLL